MEREGTTLINDSVWHHAVFTYDGSSNRIGMKIYLDGVEMSYTNFGSASIVGSILTNEALTIGAKSANTIPLTGQLDDLQIFDFELTSSQVSTLSGN